jgi:hypothetical protein
VKDFVPVPIVIDVVDVPAVPGALAAVAALAAAAVALFDAAVALLAALVAEVDALTLETVISFKHPFIHVVNNQRPCIGRIFASKCCSHLSHIYCGRNLRGHAYGERRCIKLE